MVESACSGRLEAVSGESPPNTPSADRAVVSNVQSDLFRDRSKTPRDHLAVKSLAKTGTPFGETFSPRGSDLERLQRSRTSVWQRQLPVRVKKIYVAGSDSSKQNKHVL